MFIFASWTKIYDQDLGKMQELKIELHYQFLEINFLAIRHKQHFEFHYEFKPCNGAKW
jgi:hypothetical protein